MSGISLLKLIMEYMINLVYLVLLNAHIVKENKVFYGFFCSFVQQNARFFGVDKKNEDVT